ncbi:MAG: TonB-dependent receptor plug domain-containing protein, partial [Bacteroidales bacterium]|nr:TonB-dependent receptor plug domain-containing protein [Bacteroidales bacterium]
MNIALTLLSSLLVCFLHQGETEADSVGVKDSLRESMVSSEKKFPTPAVMATTNLYSRAESSLLPYQTLESVLRNSPSVDIRERGGKGVQTDICLRGGSFDQTQIKLNGVTFTDVRTGHQSHSLPVDMDIVGGVEVLDGVQGVGAYAGAINFNTAPIMPQYLRLHTTVGQFGYMYGNLSGAYTNGGTTFMGAVSGRRSGGYIHNTDFDNFNLFFRAASDTKAGLFDIQGGYQKRGFGANGFYSLSYPDQYEQTSTLLGSVRWLCKYGRWEYSATASYRGNTDRFELIRGDESKVPFNHHLTHNLGAEAWIAREWGWGRSSLGADLSYNEIYSTVLGDALPEPRKVLGTQYTKNGSRAVGNFWLRHNKYWDRFSVAFSGGFSSHPYGNGTMGSFEAGWYPMGGLKVCAGGVKSMRLPTFNDLYYTAKGYVSNPDLVPE